MTQKQLERLIKWLEVYDQWKFCGRDKPIHELVRDIEDTIKNLE